MLVSPTAIFAAVLFSMAVGVFFGFYPARKAAAWIRLKRCGTSSGRRASALQTLCRAVTLVRFKDKFSVNPTLVYPRCLPASFSDSHIGTT